MEQNEREHVSHGAGRSREDIASDLLYSHWMRGSLIDELPPDIRPKTKVEAYAIQARLEARSKLPLYGWKIAATSIAGQQHIGVNGPLAGRLLAERVIPSGCVVPHKANHMSVAEVEFAFVFGSDLPPRAVPYTVEEVLDAVAAVGPAIEIPDSRYRDFVKVGACQLIADNACAHYFVEAKSAATDWRQYPFVDHPIVGRIEGKSESVGRGQNVLGDPRTALRWLVNELSSLGPGVKQGQTVTTGTCLPPMPIVPGDTISADFGELGTITAKYGASEDRLPGAAAM